MYFEFPKHILDDKNSETIPLKAFPYQLSLYGINDDAEEIRVLSVVKPEILDLIRRFVVVLPELVTFNPEKDYANYSCIVMDENTGVSRGVLQRLGYVLEETEHSPFGLYRIDLKTKTE